MSWSAAALAVSLGTMPNCGIESRSVRRILEKCDTRAMFSDEKPKRVFKFIQLALLAKLIDEVVLFALALPSLDDAATSVGPRALSRIDAENNRPDWQLE